MKIKDWIILGLIIAIALFFFGAMISSILYDPSVEYEEAPDYTVDKVSKSLKLIGLGLLTTTMILGGIIGNDLHKHFKLILLIIGLVLLLIFSIGAQLMKWDNTPSSYYDSYWGSGMAASGGEEEEYSYAPPSTPGFELIAVVGAIGVVLLVSKIKRRK